MTAGGLPYEIAFPILEKIRLPCDPLCLHGSDCREQQDPFLGTDSGDGEDQGFDIQGHTKTHRILTSWRRRSPLRNTLKPLKENSSRKRQNHQGIRLDKDVKYLAYPDGETNHLVIELVKKDGYRGAFTVNRGGNPFFVHNYRINRSMIYGDF